MAGDSTAGRRDGGGRENDGMQEAEGEGWREKDATSISTHNPMIRLHTKSFSPHNNDLNEIFFIGLFTTSQSLSSNPSLIQATNR
jgi:hypothetical protein